jgi:ABC-type multidrug transport system permease subunit
MMLFAFVWAGWAIQEKNITITTRLLLTIKPRQYVAGNLIGMLLLQCVLLTGFMLYGKEEGYWAADELPKAAASLLIYAFLITAFVFWLAHYVRSMKSWGMITITVLLLSSLFSGTFIPLNELSQRLQQIAYFTPQFWASDSITGSVSFPVLAGMAALALLMAALTTQKAGVQR